MGTSREFAMAKKNMKIFSTSLSKIIKMQLRITQIYLSYLVKLCTVKNYKIHYKHGYNEKLTTGGSVD